ncbi:DVU0298 family protein [Desulfitobacterium sp.]|uniref:DVU0298 family protein n=1 Tax=Desulfitobacterium sp. TaxID=49981 RepID=UPI002CFE1AD6|nr:DVU0298 family protein [Desulfitobacterium sp.]HVJ48041.1 methylated-DNA--[protein]-cysteine S-methyltransferase [Desulfitobacterium sp.]
MIRSELQRILLEKDWQLLREKAVEDRGIVQRLMSRIFVKDGLQFWRAIEGLGIAAQTIEEHEPGYAVELVRRYFGSLNEESGETAWNAAEAIGSILAHCPDECGHFNRMYSGLLADESLNEGTLWGLAQLAAVAPEHVFPLAEAVLPFLESSNPELRGRASLVQAIVDGWEEKIPEPIEKELQGDQEKIELYFNEQLQVYSIAELFQPRKVHYWHEDMETNKWTWTLTVASTSQGLFWVGLGEPEVEEKHLQAYLKRWCPQAFLVKRRVPNAQVIEQLKEYFSGQRQCFTLPLHQMGTPFQLSVWAELSKIPYGVTCSYGDIAQRIGNPKGQRAVGMANHNNPIGVIVPCHRVIGKSGALTGYAGGIHLKERLIVLEQQSCI